MVWTGCAVTLTLEPRGGDVVSVEDGVSGLRPHRIKADPGAGL